jgi:hypothetical protein
MQTALALVAAYLLGSVPFAMLSSKLFGLADPRSYGSGNPGATNVLRSGNKKAALLTLIGDALKGTVAVVVAQQAGLSDNQIALVALAVFLGHLRHHAGNAVVQSFTFHGFPCFRHGESFQHPEPFHVTVYRCLFASGCTSKQSGSRNEHIYPFSHLPSPPVFLSVIMPPVLFPR